MKRTLLALSLLALGGPALARELPTFFQGVRPLGMGGAFTAVADDENALFYNPAGLDKVKGWGLGVLNPLVEVNKEGVDFYKDARDTDLNDTVEVTRLLQDHIGDYLHARAALFPNYYTRYFAMGALGQVTVNAQPNNEAFPELDVSAFASGSGHVAAGYGFFDGVLRIGAGAKYVYGKRLEEVYTAADIAAEGFEDRVRDEDLQTGSGIGFDAGAMLEFPVVLKPTLAVMVQNIGDVDLGDAGELPQQVNVGASLSHAFSWLTVTGAADYVDVTKDVGLDDDVYKRLHFGLEAKLPKVLALRCGLYQGYASFGGTLDLGILQVDYATYAEELGSSAGDRADRRHSLQVSLGW